jgi:prepilin-type N-terminal cleavage/methylation domain-containing protein
MRQRRSGSRLGYTLAELLIAVSIVAILTGISMPRLGKVRDKTKLSGATTKFTRAVMAARQAAIQQGKHAFFKTQNNEVWVYVDPTGNTADQITVVRTTNLSNEFGVTITSPSGLTSIEYDPRGVSTQASKQTFKFQHTGSGMQDSLCVSRLGNTIREQCP